MGCCQRLKLCKTEEVLSFFGGMGLTRAIPSRQCYGIAHDLVELSYVMLWGDGGAFVLAALMRTLDVAVCLTACFIG